MSIVTLLTSSTQVSARTIEGVDFPETTTVAGVPLKLNGVGLRRKTIFQVKVYVAGLYLPTLEKDSKTVLTSDSTKEIRIVFLRDVKAKDIVASWEEGFKKNCKENCESYAESLQTLNALTRDMKNKQSVIFRFMKDGVQLETPGAPPKTIPSLGFAKIVLAIFIGEQPPTEDLREGMMGNIILADESKKTE